MLYCTLLATCIRRCTCHHAQSRLHDVLHTLMTSSSLLLLMSSVPSSPTTHVTPASRNSLSRGAGHLQQQRGQQEQQQHDSAARNVFGAFGEGSCFCEAAMQANYFCIGCRRGLASNICSGPQPESHAPASIIAHQATSEASTTYVLILHSQSQTQRMAPTWMPALPRRLRL